jgi:hypothetical protein
MGVDDAILDTPLDAITEDLREGRVVDLVGRELCEGPHFVAHRGPFPRSDRVEPSHEIRGATLRLAEHSLLVL